MPEFNLLHTVLFIGGLIAFVMGVVAYLIMGDRWVSAWVQDRLGPNRVGPWGLFQPMADGAKMFLKEDIIPAHVDKVFFVLAPFVAFTTGLTAVAVVPVGGTTPPPAPTALVAADGTNLSNADAVTRFEAAQAVYKQHFSFVLIPGLDIGILYTFAIGSLAVYGVILAGWSANNKYALLGSLRSSAQIISYEIPLGMSVVGVVVFAGSLNLETVVDWQRQHGWFLFYQPLAFLLFMVSVFAECNRLPFDLPEAEQELVGGYHTEYSNSMKLGLLLLAEYAHMLTTSFLMAVVFCGGWTLFGLEDVMADNPVVNALIRMGILGGKVGGFVMLYLLVRWTIPRFRFDQLMDIAWKAMIPLAILHLLAALLVREFGLSPWVLTVASAGLFVGAGALAVGRGPNNAPRPRVHALLPPAPVAY